MNQQQLNRLSALNDITGLFHQLDAAWKNITPIVLSFEELTSICSTIENTQYYDEQRVSEGVTLKESLERFNLINQSYTLELKLIAFAKANGHKQLSKQLDFSFSELKGSSEAVLIKRCSTILQNAKKYKAAGFFVADETLIDLDLALEIYKLVCIKHNPTAEEQANRETNLDVLFAEADKLLKHLDKLIAELVTDKEFLSAYQRAKKATSKRAKPQKV